LVAAVILAVVDRRGGSGIVVEDDGLVVERLRLLLVLLEVVSAAGAAGTQGESYPRYDRSGRLVLLVPSSSARTGGRSGSGVRLRRQEVVAQIRQRRRTPRLNDAAGEVAATASGGTDVVVVD